MQFWQPNTFIDATTAPSILTIFAANSSSISHLNAFSGAEIDKAWREKLLGPEHAYNKVLNNNELFDSLSLKQLRTDPAAGGIASTVASVSTQYAG